MSTAPGLQLLSRKVTSAMVAFFLVVFLTTFVYDEVLQAQNRPLMRFPDIHENTVVFVYGQDIWSVSAEGGVATRLTIHDGSESFPKFSPDGSLIAFTGQYDGNSDVYVMNVYGGEIERVTYHPGNDRVVGWHPIKNKIMFISARSHFRFSRLYLVSPDGTGLEELIMHNISQGSFSPDGKKLAYNRVSRENRTWKRYRGGTAQEVYLYDLETNEERNLTNFERTDRIPMWIGDRIYFSSDRDRVLNIYSCEPASGDVEQLTRHTEYDVRRPSMGGRQIVYELGGSIWLLNVDTKTTRQIPIEIHTDLPEVRPYLKDVQDDITGIDCSPTGKRALIIARGEVFTVPVKDGQTRNLTADPGSRDKDAAWSPDGKTVAYISDRSGEYEIYLVDPMGAKEAVKLTTNKDGYRHTLRWSPDSKKIAFTDQTLTLYILDVATKKITNVDKAEYEIIDVSNQDVKPIYDFAWSPDNKYITYSKMNKDLVYQVFVYSLDDKKVHQVSNGLYNDFHPVFSADGKYLFFISNRRFNPTFGDFEWEMVYKKTSGIYCITLNKDGQSILPYKSDEEEETTEPAAKKDKKTGTKSIDFDGIADRVEALPLPRGNYRYLSANESSVFYLNKDEGDFNRFAFRDVGAMDLYAYSIQKQKESLVIEEIDSYKLSANGSNIVYKQGNKVGIIGSSSVESKGSPLKLSDLKMRMVPMAEWKQIFNDAWRLERDYYYEPNMNGQDWLALKEKYGRLVPHASCRQDIRYIIGELIGELNSSHTYSYGGDNQRSSDRVAIGLLGTEWEIDQASNRYRFKRIMRTPDWSRDIMPPLAKPGLNVNDGDYLLEVNDQNVTADKNIYSYFEGLAGKQVTLLISSQPAKTGSHKIVVKPLRSERTLRYQDWAEQNRRIVEKASAGQIGYIHMPDTFAGSGREFAKYFYGQSQKKGIILDGRFNGGGLDPDLFLQRLQKKSHAFWTRRQSHDQTAPFHAVNAHMVCLTNRQAGSGGDEVPYEFQQFGMGPVIGTKTWGGLIGYSVPLTLIDGGGITAPDYRIYDSDGNWVVENAGVQPDIVIDLHPEEMARGFDAQLMKGVEVLLQKIKEEPKSWPKHKPFPVDLK